MKKLDVIKCERVGTEVIVQLITINDDLKDFYREIGCSCIDIVKRRFGRVVFDVICDDEALLKDDPGTPVSWWQDEKGKEGLFGTLLLCHDDGNGNQTNATYEDVLEVLSAQRAVKTQNGTILSILFHNVY